MKHLNVAVLLLMAVQVSARADEKTTGACTRHALLVGCTKYANLALGLQLRGPANDVVLVRDLLVKRFGFAGTNIVTLSEPAGADNDLLRPTRAHIQREFQRLAKVARQGDMVYIHLSGHGGQQPQKNPDDPESYEPDGRSEIFLPADIGPWENQAQTVANAIVDVELRDWLKAIRAQGATLVVIVDTCHSGTMIRGSEVVREVSADALKIPKRAFADAQKKAEKHNQQAGPKTRGQRDELSSLQLSSHVPDLVAIYAARPDEPTIEDRLPKDGTDSKPYGLLTYTLVQVVTQAARPLTYQEVVQRIHARYVEMGRVFPVPSVEGKDRDLEFLGQKSWPGRSRVRLMKTAAGWKVNAGALLGLTVGSILTVYPPADNLTKKGHVRVQRLTLLDAAVEPCAFAGLPKVANLPEGGNCQTVYVNYGLNRLRVALDLATKKATWKSNLQKLLSKLDQEDNSLVRLVALPAQADWLVRDMDNGVALVPAAGWVGRPEQGPDRFFGPVPFDDKFPKWLAGSLQRIARASSLVKLAAAIDQDRALSDDPVYGPQVKVELLRFTKKGPEIVRWGTKGIVMHEGDVVAFQLTNAGKQAIDASLLFVDSHFGIDAFFPEPGTETDNRLHAGKTIITPKARINAQTMGLEHLVVIAVQSRADQERIDFSCLAQPSIAQARQPRRGPADRTLETPLGQLLQTAVFASGASRGLGRQQYQNYAMQVLSWTTMPKSR